MIMIFGVRVLSATQAKTQRLVSTHWSAEPTVQRYTRRLLRIYQDYEDATAQAFNPEQVLARYCEVEALLNVDLLLHPDWQAQRAQGNYDWLRTNPYFIEQKILLNRVAQHGYTIVDREDEETGKRCSMIEKQEKQPY